MWPFGWYLLVGWLKIMPLHDGFACMYEWIRVYLMNQNIRSALGVTDRPSDTLNGHTKSDETGDDELDGRRFVA